MQHFNSRPTCVTSEYFPVAVISFSWNVVLLVEKVKSSRFWRVIDKSFRMTFTAGLILQPMIIVVTQKNQPDPITKDFSQISLALSIWTTWRRWTWAITSLHLLALVCSRASPGCGSSTWTTTDWLWCSRAAWTCCPHWRCVWRPPHLLYHVYVSVTDCSVCVGASAEQQQHQPDRRRGSGSALQPGSARSEWKQPAAPQV